MGAADFLDFQEAQRGYAEAGPGLCRIGAPTPAARPAAINLHKVLRDYLKTKGGVWSKVERDKVSGGLIEWVLQTKSRRCPV